MSIKLLFKTAIFILISTFILLDVSWWGQDTKPFSSHEGSALSPSLQLNKTELIKYFHIFTLLSRKNVNLDANWKYPFFAINAMAFGTIKGKLGILYPGGISYLRKELKGITKNGYKNIYLAGLLPIGKFARAISRGDQSEEDKNTSLYTIREHASGKKQMVINLAEPGEKDFEGSPFAAENFRGVNSQWGTIEDLESLVKEYKAQGVNFFIDFVVNHIGIDNPWIIENWDATVHKMPSAEELQLTDQELLERYNQKFTGADGNEHKPHHYFVFYTVPGNKRSRIMIAHGKDPVFDGWTDTIQLDYTKQKTRQYMLETIKFWAEKGINLRCDMANLISRIEFKNNWYPQMSWEEFSNLWPREFWVEVTEQILEKYTDMKLMLEIYGDSLHYLAFLHPRIIGYNKPLLELLKNRDVTKIKDYLIGTPIELQEKLVNLIENHDEEPARKVFDIKLQKVAAIIIATIPGIPFVNWRQTKGYKEPLRIQQWFPLKTEPINQELEIFFAGLGKLASASLFRHIDDYQKALRVLHPDNSNLLAFTRTYQKDRVLVVANITKNPQSGIIHPQEDAKGIKIDLQPYSYIILSLSHYADSEDLIEIIPDNLVQRTEFTSLDQTLKISLELVAQAI